MNIIIGDKKKKELFISIFQLLKNLTTKIDTSFDLQKLHIQGMDKSHICLFDLNLNSSWFNYYNVEKQIDLSFGDISVVGTTTCSFS
jgi:hypothetical protein